MVKEPKVPITRSIYFGSGEEGEKLIKNLQKRLKPRQSLSNLIVDLIRKADPAIFKDLQNNG